MSSDSPLIEAMETIGLIRKRYPCSQLRTTLERELVAQAEIRSRLDELKRELSSSRVRVHSARSLLEKFNQKEDSRGA